MAQIGQICASPEVTISSVRVGAPFASPLLRSAEPSARQVRQAIAKAVSVVHGCAAPGRTGLRQAPRDRVHPDALGADGSGQRIWQLAGRAGPRPGSRPLLHALYLPCRMRHR